MILDGKALRDKILEELKSKIEKENLHIKLAIILVGDNEASKIYIKNKEKACEKVGIEVSKYLLSKDTTEEELINLIKELNSDEEVTGIILQSPVPSHIDFDKCSGTIKSEKDVDGFTKDNVYNLYLNHDTILPCTVAGIIRMLDEYDITLDGASVVIVGRGNIVGKPLGLALLNKNATVIYTHSHTHDLKTFTKNADIVIAACGVPKLITKDMVKNGATVIDVGVSRVDGKIVGDVDFDEVKNVASYITPNPGGVGPMTVAMIIDNLVYMKERIDNDGQNIKRRIK